MEPETQPKFDSSELLIITLEIPWHYKRRKSLFSLDKKYSETLYSLWTPEWTSQMPCPDQEQ